MSTPRSESRRGDEPGPGGAAHTRNVVVWASAGTKSGAAGRAGTGRVLGDTGAAG